MKDNLNIANARVEIDDEASDLLKSIVAVMDTLAAECPGEEVKTENVRSLDSNRALFVLNGCARILFNSMPLGYREIELDAFCKALRKEAPQGATVKQHGGSA